MGEKKKNSLSSRNSLTEEHCPNGIPNYCTSCSPSYSLVSTRSELNRRDIIAEYMNSEETRGFFFFLIYCRYLVRFSIRVRIIQSSVNQMAFIVMFILRASRIFLFIPNRELMI